MGWNLVNLRRIDTVPHDTDPAFCRHHIEHGNHCFADIVKVLRLVYPFTAYIVTVPHRLDFTLNFLGHVISETVEELAFEECDSLNAKQHQDQKHDQYQVQDVWNRIHE